MWDNSKWPNVHLILVNRGEHIGGKKKNFFEVLMAEKLLYLIETINSQIQEAK